jgi:diguanylate cyclase (GGDEF)-like protein
MLPGIGLGGGPLFSEAIASLPEFVSFMSEPPPASAEFPLPDPEGTPRRYRARSFPIGGGATALGKAILLTDISETAALLARLNELACVDGLTSLLNRRRFFEIARREVDLARRSGRPFSVCIADLDFFKSVNDTYGHAAGDAVLREVSRRFQGELRSTDVLCRYGGEEFALFFPDSGPELAAGAVERIRLRLAESPVAWEGAGISISASFGVSAGDMGAGDDDVLDLSLRQADLALYAAKEAGRNCVRIRGA